jgi:uncharacterized protein (DUF2252 family)
LAQPPAQSHGQPHSERRAAGRALRQACPRSKVATWKPAEQRADPVDLLIANSAERLPDLVPIRYGRMMASPFAFYSGAAAIMAHDLSFTANTGMTVMACGDCHLVNFGGFATPERRLVFDINDFDEVSVAPWEWDLERLTASFVIAGRANGFKAADCRQAAWKAARSYRESMARYAEMPVLDAYYETIDLSKLVAAGTDDELKRLNQKRIRDEPPLIFHNDDMQQQAAMHADAERMVADYVASLAPERRILMQRYRFADVAMKVVGVGSVGTYCGVALFVSGNGDPLFLQFKEARPSVLEPYCGRVPFKHHGERVVFGQRLMQAAADAFLGWTTGTRQQQRHYYVRQLRDAKIKPMVELMNPANLIDYAQSCGWALARAHKRSGDAVVLSAYMGSGAVFEDAMAAFAVRYADQNERDHAALVAAVRAGRIEARTGI